MHHHLRHGNVSLRLLRGQMKSSRRINRASTASAGGVIKGISVLAFTVATLGSIVFFACDDSSNSDAVKEPNPDSGASSSGTSGNSSGGSSGSSSGTSGGTSGTSGGLV